MNDRPPNDLRDRFDTLNCRLSGIVVFEMVANALPQDLLEGDRLLERNCLLPEAVVFAEGTMRSVRLNE
jgi:hypothetical protein